LNYIKKILCFPFISINLTTFYPHNQTDSAPKLPRHPLAFCQAKAEPKKFMNGRGVEMTNSKPWWLLLSIPEEKIQTPSTILLVRELHRIATSFRFSPQMCSSYS